MSSVCGLFHRDGGRTEPGELRAMLDALDHWGADAREVWEEGAAGLGRLALRDADPERREAPLHHDPVTRRVLAGNLRLDNREALAGELGIAPGDLSTCPDGRLVLEAWRKWGGEAPVHLMGDFAFAVWEPASRTLTCVRDPLGVKPLYYHDGPRLFAFASEIKGLLALPGVPREVDGAWVTDLLCRLVLEDDRTLWSSVRRLPPGHLLVTGPEGTGLARWFELEAPPELRLDRDKAYVEGFRDALVGAVRRRLRTAPDVAVGAELSGGLDSSAGAPAAGWRARGGQRARSRAAAPEGTEKRLVEEGGAPGAAGPTWRAGWTCRGGWRPPWSGPSPTSGRRTWPWSGSGRRTCRSASRRPTWPPRRGGSSAGTRSWTWTSSGSTSRPRPGCGPGGAPGATSSAGPWRAGCPTTCAWGPRRPRPIPGPR